MSDNDEQYIPIQFTSGIERDANRAGQLLPQAKRLLRALLESSGNHHDLADHLCEYSYQSDDELWANERYAEPRRLASGMAPLLETDYQQPLAAIVELLDSITALTPREVRDSHLEQVRHARKLAALRCRGAAMPVNTPSASSPLDSFA